MAEEYTRRYPNVGEAAWALPKMFECEQTIRQSGRHAWSHMARAICSVPSSLCWKVLMDCLVHGNILEEHRVKIKQQHWREQRYREHLRALVD
jgi:hypothetical protein